MQIWQRFWVTRVCGGPKPKNPKRDDFCEAYPDEGDVDMRKAVRTYREVGYDGMLMYGPIPAAPGNSEASCAFAYGYIRALIQAAES